MKLLILLLLLSACTHEVVECDYTLEDRGNKIHIYIYSEKPSVEMSIWRNGEWFTKEINSKYYLCNSTERLGNPMRFRIDNCQQTI